MPDILRKQYFLFKVEFIAAAKEDNEIVNILTVKKKQNLLRGFKPFSDKLKLRISIALIVD